MSMTNNGNDRPSIAVLAQYVKDLSFENPNSPASLAPTQQQPDISIQINVEARPLNEPDVEVMLKLEGRALSNGNVLFNFELNYAGIFRLQNIPQEEMHPAVLIECPRLLFPFAREIVATSVRNGGFPPLLLEPVDFVALYQRKMAELQAAAPAGQA